MAFKDSSKSLSTQFAYLELPCSVSVGCTPSQTVHGPKHVRPWSSTGFKDLISPAWPTVTVASLSALVR